jgi:hypothetical protein
LDPPCSIREWRNGSRRRLPFAGAQNLDFTTLWGGGLEIFLDLTGRRGAYYTALLVLATSAEKR